MHQLNDNSNMERTPEHIDDIFRKRLHDAAPPPPAFVWDNVERALRKRKRRFIFWIFTVGVVGAGTVGYLLQQQGQGRQLTQHTVAPLSETLNQQPVAASIPAAPINTSATTTVAVDAPSAVTTDISKRTTPSFTTKSTTASTPVVAPLTETTPGTLEAKPQKPFFEGKLSSLSSALLPMHQPIGIRTIRPGVLSSDMVRKSWPELLKPRPAKIKAKKAASHCYDFARQPSVWMLEAYLGPSLAQREMNARPDDRPYLNKRLSTEKRDLAYNVGVRAALMLKGNFLVRAGLNYDQMTEVFEYIDPEYVRTIVANVYDPNTGLTTLDTVGVEYGEKYLKTYNRFGMLDLPLTAGIELRKGRSGFNINAGMSFNLLFWKRGAILAPQTNEPAWFTPSADPNLDVFRVRAGMSATASVQWFYHVKPRLRVFVEPSFRKVLRPVTLQNHPVEQRYGIGGLRLGFTRIL
jgi:hypothetical protein